MDVLSTEQMIAREKEAFSSGIIAEALMNAAGHAMGREIRLLYPDAHDFLVLIGKGNNGGDGLVVAQHLARLSKNVHIVLTCPEDQLGDLPLKQLENLREEFPETSVFYWSDQFDFPPVASLSSTPCSAFKPKARCVA